jgi:DNA-binding transcriptional MerR regulator
MGDAVHLDGERYSREQVRRILRLSPRQLSAWERQGLVQPRFVSGQNESAASGRPSMEQPKRRAPQTGVPASYYTFTDIVTLKTLLQLRKNGVPPARLRLAHEALKRKLAEVEKPWSELQIKGSGKNLIVQFQGTSMEPVTGQLLLEYSSGGADEANANGTSAGKEGSGRIQPFRRTGRLRKHSPAEKRAIAERFFAAGLRYEERGESAEKAIQAYQKAIEMNPEAVGAFINLGTVYYNLGQMEAAESCYQSALSIEPDYALVHFNLGNVADEKNDLPRAREHYEEAIRREPAYSDPHYNLALVYEKLGLHGKARQQWLRYLKLDHQSEWASYARQQLEKTPLRLIPGRPADRASAGNILQPERPSGFSS